MNTKLIALFFIFAAAGCGSGENYVSPSHRPPSPVEIEQPEEIKVPEYSYGGDAYRSPFSPEFRRQPSEVDEDAHPLFENVNPDSLNVTGIVSDARSKYAILSGPDEYYIVRDGRLLDRDDRQVSGVAAVISEDRVTLITKDEETIELQAPEW